MCIEKILKLKWFSSNKHEKYYSYNDAIWSEFERMTLILINDYRSEIGLKPLKKDDKFYIEAWKRAKIQAEQGYLSHDGMNVTTENLIPLGIKFTSENLGKKYVSAKALVDAWINSPKHHKNIVNRSWKYTGIARVIDENGKAWYCQTFGY